MSLKVTPSLEMLGKKKINLHTKVSTSYVCNIPNALQRFPLSPSNVMDIPLSLLLSTGQSIFAIPFLSSSTPLEGPVFQAHNSQDLLERGGKVSRNKWEKTTEPVKTQVPLSLFRCKLEQCYTTSTMRCLLVTQVNRNCW